jgi:predicted Zn-dependent protease
MDTDTAAADAYPDGVVVVSAHLFDVLDNEAQLAFVLAHEVARVVEKQEWTTLKCSEQERTGTGLVGFAALGLGGLALADMLDNKRIAHRFARGLQNQADRVGIEYMLAAGYDPSQAVESWRVLEKKHAQGRFGEITT